MKSLAIDLYAGLGGWTDGLLEAGFDVIGFDIENHRYGPHRYPADLVLQDVRTIDGSQFANADLIVASPPCQRYSYMAMPWTRAKKLAAWYRDEAHPERLVELNELFDTCFRIQREASEAAGRRIPLVVENVCGAQPWVGRARWHYGSYYLWGDVPALMPIVRRARKVPGFRFDGSGKSCQSASVGVKVGGLDWKPPDHPKHRTGQAFNPAAQGKAVRDGIKNGGRLFPNGCADLRTDIKNTGGSWFGVAHNTTSGKGRNPVSRRLDGERNDPRDEGVKQGGEWFHDSSNGTLRSHSSKSSKRKAASALIAKIPFELAYHIGRTYRRREAAA